MISGYTGNSYKVCSDWVFDNQSPYSVQHQPIRLLEELPLTSMVMEHLPRSSSVLVYAKKVISIVKLSLLSDHFMNY